MNRLTDSLLPAFAVAATGLAFGAWLFVKGCLEIRHAPQSPITTDAHIGRIGASS